jgi:hypothetical protein
LSSTPQIIDVSPAPNAQGVPIGDQLRIVFDQEMDLDSINTGTIVLTGPDEAPLFGPHDVTPFDDPGFEDEDILSSPYFKGYVKGTISFSRVDASGGLVSDDEVDEGGAGNLWRTVALFTPEKPLRPSVSYTAIVLGDEAANDDFDTGVKTRTVFDTVFTGSGSGRITFAGGYTGDVQASYTIEVTAGGSTGTAEYIWWNDADPLTVYQGLTTTGERELESGVYVTCDPDGSFTIGDKFEVVVVPAIVLPNNYRWSFTTGSGAIITPPSSSSTSGIGSYTDDSLEVVSIVPVDTETNLAPADVTTIVITFNKELDPATVTDAVVKLWSEPVNGEFYNNPIEFTGTLTKVISVSGNTLTLQIS